MNFEKDIVVNGKYKIHAKVTREFNGYTGTVIKVSFFDSDNKQECFTVLPEECTKENTFDPKLAITIAAKKYLHGKKEKEKIDHIYRDFESWDGVINFDK